MEKSPLVSVILSTYNRASFITKAIESVLRQSYRELELIIVNDSSTDGTSEILNSYTKKNSRIRVVTNVENIGLVTSLNKGVRNARGKYIARIDDDDFWCDVQKLEKQIMFLQGRPEYALVGGGAIYINKKGEELMRLLLPEDDEAIRKSILINNPFVHSTVVFSKRMWEEAGGYNETLFWAEDWDLWMRLGQLGKLYNFQEYFTRYRYNVATSSVRAKRLKINNALRVKYRNEYTGFAKAYFMGLVGWFFSFFPIPKRLYPLFFFFRKSIVKNTPYRMYSRHK